MLTVAGDIAATLRGLAEHAGTRPDHEPWIAELRAAEEAARAAEAPLLEAGDGPIKPTRVYGELRKRLARDAVVICDGGDFASYAGKYVEVFEPGCWLDTGPYGCLGNGMGYSIAARVARPEAQIVVAARRRCRRVQPDGRRLARSPWPAGRDGRRQQRDVGPGEAPDAGDLRLGRGLRPAARLPLRRGRAGARRRRGAGDRSGARSARPWTAASPPACRTSSTSSPIPPTSTRARPTSADRHPADLHPSVPAGRVPAAGMPRSRHSDQLGEIVTGPLTSPFSRRTASWPLWRVASTVPP